MSEIIGLLTRFIDAGKIPGAQLAVFSDGILTSVVAGKVSGFTLSSDVNPSTLYDVASLTKVVVTTTLILMAHDEGRLKFDDKVIRYLPSYRHPHVTIHHLLTHTAGYAAKDEKFKIIKDKEGMQAFILKKDLAYQSGTRVEYTDIGFILLGFILEDIYGDIEQAAIKRIFVPLDMQDTCFNPASRGWAQRCAPTEIQSERGLIQGVVHDWKAYRMGGISGNAGLFSTAYDLMKFALNLLDDASSILHKKSIALLKEDQTSGLNLRRTYGWQTYDPGVCHFGNHAGDKVLFHTGFTGTSLYIDFTRKTVIVLLTNRFLPDVDNVAIKDIRTQVHDAILAEIPPKK
jgi:CubicO group peptidase (beta-lactamase class C family)